MSYIQFQTISKHFGGVNALSEVSLSIPQGHVHGLMGENGAGKSTLGKVLAGIHVPNSGQIVIDGKPQSFRSPADALKAGVGMVHQELAAEKRIVLDTPNFVAFAPFASRFPFETWILPKHHNSHYENIQKIEVISARSVSP